LRQIKARLNDLHKWLKEEMRNDAPPTLADVIQNILDRKAKEGQSSRSQTIYNLKDAAKMFNFLIENKIMDMAGLDKYFGDMFARQLKISDELKPIDRRLKTLDKHIAQAEIIKQHGGIYRQYKAQPPKKQEHFYETHRMELTLYEAAERYIKGVLNGRDTIPLPTWKTERVKLTADKKRLDSEYVNLKSDIKEVEQIRRNVYDILHREERERQPQKSQNIDR
jgi:hypothetical protein